MLITKQELLDATELSAWEVRAALRRGGEPDTNNDIKSVSFQGLSESGHFVYKIRFRDEEGCLGEGNVYLKFFPKLVGDDIRHVLEGTV